MRNRREKKPFEGERIGCRTCDRSEKRRQSRAPYISIYSANAWRLPSIASRWRLFDFKSGALVVACRSAASVCGKMRIKQYPSQVALLPRPVLKRDSQDRPGFYVSS